MYVQHLVMRRLAAIVAPAVLMVRPPKGTHSGTSGDLYDVWYQRTSMQTSRQPHGTPQRNTLCYNNPWSLSAAHRPTVRTGGGSDPEPAAGAVGLWSEGGRV